MYIRVKVYAGLKKESFKEKGKDSFEVAVKEPAERNLANNRVLELVADHYGVKKNKIRIISGHHHQSKILSLDI